MLKFAFIFLIIALVAGVFAFTDIAAAAPGIAQILFYAFLVLFVIAAIGWVLARRKARSSRP
ncbi:DUF1328 domain-containing protein [Desulfoferula mesophila]|uniref:Uncharacterized protein n=1 Tax=Desulfoferula mesophila TaxID=3058419 RepID=A0AAU9EBB3_9BACT|nr:hypothetical protein FAK_12410 [Desulfoferula mesophilus]